MRTRFDLTSKANVIQHNKLLLHLRQNNNESLAEYLGRFRFHVVAANANTENNLFLSCHSILSLFIKGFRDIVDKTPMEHHLRTKAYSNPSSTMGESSFAHEAHIHYVPKNSSALEEILIANFISLEQVLGKIQRSINQKKTNTRQSNKNPKKRKMNHSSSDYSQQGISKSVMDVEKLKYLSHKLTKAEMDYLRAKKISISCRKAPFSSEHSRICEERKKYLQSKVNTKHLSFTADSLEASFATDSLTINKHDTMEHSTNSSFFGTSRNSPSVALLDIDDSDNEYQQHPVPDHLILADDRIIANLQTIDFVSVDYDGAEHSIQHRFDVADDFITSYEDNILVGVNLMLKLHIHLVNVAFKYKNVTRVDDSMDDKPYEPNVNLYETDKEQKAFFTALAPYIEANKKLDSNILCNLPESVLFLPTPSDFYVNVRQYPHSLLYAA
ncbi:hypothetical protein RMATCC62417_16255 [Rhizopus microsporus]|nr:hypothetical protein RMATCC62417_16255 [Rhizopus microsporus]